MVPGGVRTRDHRWQIPGRLRGVQGDAGSFQGRQENSPTGFPSDEVQLLLFWFLEDEPGESWTAIADCHEERLAATHLLSPVWMSPFVATVPGTDRYMDSLWLTP